MTGKRTFHPNKRHDERDVGNATAGCTECRRLARQNTHDIARTYISMGWKNGTLCTFCSTAELRELQLSD